ncbi:hypothetical protein AgCh_003685 [Apium graveolens]
MELSHLRNKRDEQSVLRYKEVKNHLFLILDQREIFWRQRSKQLWLQAGDKNTKYFHASASTRRRSNRIQRLRKVDGEWCDWDSGLANLISGYFQDLFNSEQTEEEEVIRCVKESISSEQNAELLKQVTAEEVKKALFQMNPDKSPGPDGMTPAFYQKHWSIIGGDVVDMVRKFFQHGIITKGLNDTNIVLIPKKKNPSSVGDLRPISLCNVVMKVITKVLANRMKEMLVSVVSDTQSAFILGRLISDNIMVAYEVMHYLKRKRIGKDGYMALKLDMSKAYDRIEWSFLSKILRRMGFSSWWTHLVLQCVSTVSYNIVHGDVEMGPIVPSRGIRQGDPLTISLVTKVYKARYFTDSNFFNSKLGSNPSFVWRSIWESKDLVKNGVRWNIGPGNQITIKDQPWLEDEFNPCITTNSEVLENQRVALIMCLDRREWDEDIVRDIFNERDQNSILNTHIAEDIGQDSMYWRLENSGVYSVRSAYKFLQVQKNRWRGDCVESVWAKIWKIKAPPKTLNTLWRALSLCLPCNMQLQQKHVQISGICPVCSDKEESIVHALVECRFTAQCWRIALPNIQVQTQVSFPGWLEQILSRCNQEDREKVAMVCWADWRARNELVWNQKESQASKVVESAVEYLKQWKLAQVNSNIALVSSLEEGDEAYNWVKPQIDTTKVSVDAAIFKDREEFGFGMVARDHLGGLIKAKSVLQKGVSTPEIAEAMEIKEALSWIKQEGWPRVELESDSLVTVQAVRSSLAMRSPFGRIVEECRSSLSQLSNVALFFIRRSANMVAHQLAKTSYLYSDRSFDRRSVPIDVMNYILADCPF